MSIATALFSLLLVDASQGCLDGAYAQMVHVTEERLLVRVPPMIPQDGQIGMQRPLCVRVAFHIDTQGLPLSVHVDKSSKNRAWDVAGLEAVRKSRFRPPETNSLGQDFYLVYSFD